MHIFCSYHFVKGIDSGFGNVVLQTNEKLPLSLREIRRLERKIKEVGFFDNVVLLNFCRVRSEKKEGLSK